MGGKGKHQQQRQKKRGGGDKGRQLRQQQEEEDDDDLPWYAPPPPPPPPLASSEHHGEKIECAAAAAAYLQQPHAHDVAIDKYSLYQRSVQSPRGDISYLLKFFLVYIGGRTPLRLREDFCGTALICAEWVQGDARRTAVGLDLDIEALHWGLQHNLLKASGDAHRRVTLYQGDVRFPISRAKLIGAAAAAHCCSHSLSDAFEKQTSLISEEEEGDEEDGEDDNDHDEEGNEEVTQAVAAGAGAAADIVCAFNYSCCCLHTRNDLVLYFQQVRQTLTDEGGIFAMDLYGGTSSECALKLRRRFENFMYTWEQEEFDVTTRTTKISLHFRIFKEQQRVLRHAFSYHWRLWTIPEVTEALKEAGFQEVHIWMREMSQAQEQQEEDEEVDMNNGVKYEEVDSFQQVDAWNAYVVAVSPQTL
ncbi:hypothetical protein BDL97_06G056400 [Sphagnum fallax]|nr:hypothetical protein BDL97_06G056400 [Sphagnum fallax]